MEARFSLPHGNSILGTVLEFIPQREYLAMRPYA